MASFFTTLAAHPIIPFFLLANLAIGFWAHRKAIPNSFEDYALASRSLPTGVLVMTLLGTYIGTECMAYPSYFFDIGLVQLVFPIFQIGAFLLIGTFIAPFLVYFNDSNTLGSVMGNLYGRFAQVIVSLISIFSAFLIIGAQIRAIGLLGKNLLDFAPSTSILFFGILIVIYSTIGGARAVSYTDVLQLVLAFVVFGLITEKIIVKVGGIQTFFDDLYRDYPEKVKFVTAPKFSRTVKKAIFYDLSGAFLLSLPMLQRMLMTKEKRNVRKMWYASSFLFALIWAMVTIIGLGALVANIKFESIDQSKDIFFHLIQFFFADTQWIIDFMFLGVIGILFSTIDSYLHATSIALINDVLDPIRISFQKVPLTEKQKIVYSQRGMLLVGLLSVCFAYLEGSSLINKELYKCAVIISSLFIIPLIIGIIGINTNTLSWVGFCIGYVITFFSLQWIGWDMYDAFVTALPLGTFSYFLTHIYLNGGIVTLKRSEQTIAEQLWLPSWKGAFEYIKRWLFAPFNLPILASRKIVSKPTHSLSFSMVIFALYTFSSVMTGGSNDMGLANFMAGVHLVGITLCVGLMLEGIWPDRLKPYFALYWFFALFYCLSFGSTLAFLRAHGDTIAVGKWIVNFLLLAFLVDSASFITLTCLGSGLAMASWYVVLKSMPPDLLDSIGLFGGYLLFVLLLVVLLFESSREQYSSQRLDWNRTASGILGHDLRLTVQMLSGVGNVLNNTFKTAESITNSQGKQGYWIEKEQTKFLEGFGTKLIEKSKEARDDIKRFIDFMEQQVMGWLEQEKVSMHKVAQDVIRKMKDKYASSMQMTISCQKDFEANVFSVFPNVIANLLKNASKHGKATKFDIKIDGEKRMLVVRDNGKGIPSDVLPRIFDLNFSTGDKRDENSGVGLAFVKMVMNASSGKVSCCSRHGDKDSFTEFIMEFPEV